MNPSRAAGVARALTACFAFAGVCAPAWADTEAIARIENDVILTRSPSGPNATARRSIASAVPNDPLFGSQWALRNTGQMGGTPGADVDAARAWDLSIGGSDIILAVIDTGFDFAHPDLVANTFVNSGEVPANAVDDDGNGFVDDVQGWDFVGHDALPADDNGHGTLLSGAAAATGNNALGMVGLGWNIRILPIKCLDSGGTGTTSNLVAGILYATQMGADVILAGWGGGAYSQALFDAIGTARAAGIPFVCPAGGSGVDIDAHPVYPASYALTNVVAVAASDDDDARASFSNWGPGTVDLAAPGVAVTTTLTGGATGLVSGTGVAASLVAGAFGLLAAHDPSATGDAMIARLLANVDVLASLTGVVASNGRLNAYLPLAWTPSDTPDEWAQNPTHRQRLWWGGTTSASLLLRFELVQEADIRIDVFDVRGRFVRVVRMGRLVPGLHTATWDGTDERAHRVGRGVYVARLRTAQGTSSTRIPSPH